MGQSSETAAEWVVLVNPAAGGQRGRDDWGRISRLLDRSGLRWVHHLTEHRRHAVPLIHRCLEQGYRKFILVGGDGSLHEAVNAIFMQGVLDPGLTTLALIPVGSGNDWARTFNIPSDYESAVQVIRSGKTLRHDIGRVFYQGQAGEESSYFINMCGIGFDAEVARKASADGARGHLGPMKYRYHLFASLMGYAPTRMTVVIDGKESRQEVFSMAVGVAQYSGGGMKQLPFAVANDGLFDLTLIRRITRAKVMRSLHKIYDGSFVELPEVSTYRGKAIRIESDPGCWLEADGEVLGESPFRFEILPQALNVVVA